MKLCPRALKIKEGYEKDQTSFDLRRSATDRESQARSMASMTLESKRAMARRLNTHVSQCKQCVLR